MLVDFIIWYVIVGVIFMGATLMAASWNKVDVGGSATLVGIFLWPVCIIYILVDRLNKRKEP
jgi:hypothetical protein